MESWKVQKGKTWVKVEENSWNFKGTCFFLSKEKDGWRISHLLYVDQKLLNGVSIPFSAFTDLIEEQENKSAS